MRLLGILLGLGLVMVGVPLILTPLPVGLILTALGALVLVASSPFAARRLKAWRGASKTVDGAIDRAEDLLPDPMSAPLERTQPKPQRTADAPLRRRVPEPWRRLETPEAPPPAPAPRR